MFESKQHMHERRWEHFCFCLFRLHVWAQFVGIELTLCHTRAMSTFLHLYALIPRNQHLKQKHGSGWKLVTCCFYSMREKTSLINVNLWCTALVWLRMSSNYCIASQTERISHYSFLKECQKQNDSLFANLVVWKINRTI